MNTTRTPSNALRSADPILEMVNLEFHLGLSKLHGSAPHSVIVAVAENQKSEFTAAILILPRS
jgi:hypothetical protein